MGIYKVFCLQYTLILAVEKYELNHHPVICWWIFFDKFFDTLGAQVICIFLLLDASVSLHVNRVCVFVPLSKGWWYFVSDWHATQRGHHVVERKAWIPGTSLNLTTWYGPSSVTLTSLSSVFPSFPQVGFFPSECVELINEKLQQSVSAPVSKQGNTHTVFYLEIRRVLEVEMPFKVSLAKLIEKCTSRRKCSVIDLCFSTHHLVVQPIFIGCSSVFQRWIIWTPNLALPTRLGLPLQHQVWSSNFYFLVVAIRAGHSITGATTWK